MASLFTFRSTQAPEIGAMAKRTLLHHVACEKATPSSGLTSLEMKIRNRHVESRLQKSLTELQILNLVLETTLGDVSISSLLFTHLAVYLLWLVEREKRAIKGIPARNSNFPFLSGRGVRGMAIVRPPLFPISVPLDVTCARIFLTAEMLSSRSGLVRASPLFRSMRKGCTNVSILCSRK
ncbi:hypothetical protein AVEN_176769-1 [Araneus ventricosus]|uniref:Uncharacterized protein n=1 Tax=Araneus ventricosus TaxID=182803 RepID=A0A4Y2LKI0_ARAVE|nr:hypothetical protein AVEN_176769-1 [Araneus ventricosus]